MKTMQNLPPEYRQVLSVDMQKDKKTSLIVNLIGAAIMLVMAIPMHFLVPIQTLFDMEQGIGLYFLRFGVLLLGSVAYIILHELTHGAVMKLCGGKQVKYGFNGIFAWAGSPVDFFGKRCYILIALAPLAVWGVIFGVLCAVVSGSWFWVVYFFQIMNVSGAAGDMYVSVRMLFLPRDTLVCDCGLGMKAYSAEVKSE